MRLNMYSVYDRLMQVYLTPFYARADVEAVRQMRNSMQDPQMAKSPLVTNPKDYDLAKVGVFDDETGLITSIGPQILMPIVKIGSVETFEVDAPAGVQS